MQFQLDLSGKDDPSLPGIGQYSYPGGEPKGEHGGGGRDERVEQEIRLSWQPVSY